MKSIDYPARLMINIDKDRGRALDALARSRNQNRPQVIIDAIDGLIRANVRSLPAEIVAFAQK